MPERNILKVRSFWVKDGDEYHFVYYSSIHQETARALALHGQREKDEYLEGTAKSLIDANGDILAVIGQKLSCKTFTYVNKLGSTMFGILIPDQLVRDYGVREDEYIDITFEQIRNPEKVELIFPKILRSGTIDIQPSGTPVRSSATMQETLLEIEFEDPFYKALASEINQAYGLRLLRSTTILIRVLIENLLVELLRSKYKMAGLELFYDKAHHMHYGLSVLIGSLKERILEFRPYSSSFNDELLTKLEQFRTKTNAAAHSIDEDVRPETLANKKADIKYVCNLLTNVIKTLSRE